LRTNFIIIMAQTRSHSIWGVAKAAVSPLDLTCDRFNFGEEEAAKLRPPAADAKSEASIDSVEVDAVALIKTLNRMNHKNRFERNRNRS
jgi:hypothetical protein